jgi:hypothetical protein
VRRSSCVGTGTSLADAGTCFASQRTTPRGARACLNAPDTLAVFGLQPVKVGTTTVATKAAAAEKAVATRKARHTMGKVQKKDIHGTPPGASKGGAAGS